MDNSEIITLFISRDERAISETDAKYRGLCLSVSENIVKSRSDAEECFQDALLALWRNIPPEKPKNLGAYLCRIVRNISLSRLDYLCAQKRAEGAEVPFSEFEDFLPDSRGGSFCGGIEFSDLLNRFLSGLDGRTRSVFIRRYFFFDPVADIARDFGMTNSRTASMLMRTRKKLKKYLTEKGCQI